MFDFSSSSFEANVVPVLNSISSETNVLGGDIISPQNSSQHLPVNSSLDDHVLAGISERAKTLYKSILEGAKTVSSDEITGKAAACAAIINHWQDTHLNNQNNTVAAVATTTTTSQPDLVITQTSAPTSASTGSSITINYTLTNQGQSNAGTSYTNFYLSKDTVYDSSDTLLGSTSQGSLNAGSSVSGSKTVIISNSLAAGSYYILDQADSGKTVAEGNESNNLAYRAITITDTPKPDLTITNPTAPTTAHVGDTITLNYTLNNTGKANARSTTSVFYLSQDTVIDSNDILLGSKTDNSLNAGSSCGSSINLTLNNNIASGTYYLLYQTDGVRLVTESNENNNIAYRQITITGLTPPPGYSGTTGYGLVNAAAAVATALGQTTFANIADLGGNNWGADLINAPEVWAQGYTGEGVVVAVVDSGVDRNHSDLNDNIWVNTGEIAGDGIDNDHNGYVDDVYGWNFVSNNNNTLDDYGHGTHVAGTIAGENNGYGVTGIAYDAQIMPVKVLNSSGTGSMTDIANGIYYAVDNGADVINLSLASIAGSSEIMSALEYASSQGVIVVMAAGNSSGLTPLYPGLYAKNYGIVVGAVDKNNSFASFSNKAGNDPLAYVTAPGVGVYSTLPGNQYASWNGTSMAAPQVAGVVALMLSANPNLTETQVRDIITETAGV